MEQANRLRRPGALARMLYSLPKAEATRHCSCEGCAGMPGVDAGVCFVCYRATVLRTAANLLDCSPSKSTKQMRRTKKTKKKTAGQRKPELVKSNSPAYRKWLQLCDSVAKRNMRRKKRPAA